MDTKKFGLLLEDYLEGDISEDNLKELHSLINSSPILRRRFQREIRLHVLLRETVCVQDEQKHLGVKKSPSPASFVLRHRLLLATAAACLMLCSFLLIYFGSYGVLESNIIGSCISVSDKDDLILVRNGQPIYAAKDTPIHLGDLVKTSFEAQTLLRFNHIGMLSIEGSGEMSIQQPQPGRYEIVLKRGKVLFDIEKRMPFEPPLVVRTENSSMDVLGTVFSLEAMPTDTRIKVYEGLVDFTETASQKSIQVAADQYSVTGQNSLKAGDLQTLSADSLLPSQIELFPTDDVHSDNGKIFNTKFLKVDSIDRTIYMKFKVEDAREIVDARLRLMQNIDPGSGTIRFWQADSSDWSEDTITVKNAPKPLECITRRMGLVRSNQTIEVDVSSWIKKAGEYTIIMTLDSGGNDIWFGSRESGHLPQLVLTCSK